MDATLIIAYSSPLFSVPKLSVLLLSDIIRWRCLTLHRYVDDPASIIKVVETPEACVEDIRIWMSKNRLRRMIVGDVAHQSSVPVRNVG